MSDAYQPDETNHEDHLLSEDQLSEENLPEEESSDEEVRSNSFTDGVRFNGRTILFDGGPFDASAINGAGSAEWNHRFKAGDIDGDIDEEESGSMESNTGGWTDFSAAGPEESDNTFLKFFNTPEEDEEKRFERRFQNFFDSENEYASDDSDQPPADDADSDDETDDETEDEYIQREESEARRENIDALNRSEDAESLFILGSKYDPDDDVNMPDDETAQRSPVSILEAMLFVGDRENRPLELSKAVDLMRNVSIEEARSAIEELNRRYEMRQSPYRIKEFGENAYKMVLTSAADSVRERFGAKVREVRLSQKAIDVLAVVAYRQPVTLAEIQTERPNAGGILSQLVKRELVITEMKTVDKKPVAYYRTGERFLKVLGIESLDELPMVDEIDYR